MTLLPLFLLLLPCCRLVLSLQLNIHLPLTKVNNSWAFDKCPYNAALEANLALRRVSETEQIDFFSHHTPHVTLFLSDFDVQGSNESLVLEEITSVLQQVLSNHSQVMCEVSWPDRDSFFVAGPYSMYAVPRKDCLQSLSDDVVRALNPYIRKPQEIPPWVYTLPLLQRWRKIYMISKYGSPNVFGEYEPHITVGYDEVASVQTRTDALGNIDSPQLSCQGLITHVAIAKVGVGGSVLQTGLVSVIQLHDPNAQLQVQEE
ncbi:2'-5' RNA ligase superfamily [Fragilaria crotonensis]|nr:2'-5' RNA ligase superfamily [Fragilaria crotonensis]